MLAYLRYLAAQAGLISPRFLPEAYHVRYTEAVFRAEDYDYENSIAIVNAAHDNRLDFDTASEYLTRPRRKILRRKFTNLVCIVAFVFRSRGHHFMNDFNEQYVKLWEKCGILEGEVSFTPQQSATLGLHSIFPIVLETFWTEAKNGSHINGSLIKRWDCAPAGSASLYGLSNGITDILVVMPGVYNAHSEDIDYLYEEISYLKLHRHEGSINHTYYGVPRRFSDEHRLAGIASLVYGSYNEFLEINDAPLLGSRSLQRVAREAPFTTAVLGTVIKRITESEKFSEAYTKSIS